MTSSAPAPVGVGLASMVWPLLALLVVAPAPVAAAPAARPAAGDLPVGEELVEVTAPLPPGPEPAAAEPAASSAFVTVLQPGEQGGAGRDLAGLLGEAVGVRTSSLGGLDTYSTLSVRGSSGNQVLVLLDGVPLNSAATGSADLASLPLEGLERIEVYRGQVPTLLGGQAIGGAVNLVSRTPDRPGSVSSARAGYGSFGTWDAALGQAGGSARVRYRLALALRRTDGDFTYYDDNGTSLDPRDDTTARRVNNDVLRLGLLGRLAWRLGDWRLAAFGDAGHREGGVPGPGSDQAAHARLGTDRALVDLSAARPGPIDLAARSWLLLQQDRFDDPYGELQRPGAAPSSSESRSWSAGGRVGAGCDLPATRLELGAELKEERLSSADVGGVPAVGAASPADEGDRSRLSVALGVEPALLLGGGRLRLEPALRVEQLRSDFGGGGGAGGPATASATLWSPRLGLQLAAGPWTVKANAGLYHRAPTFYELFGGQGTMWGNPGLTAEQGTNFDLGGQLALERLGPLHGVALELVLFQRRVQRLISWLQTSQQMIQATNLGEARLTGAELSAKSGLPWGFAVRAGYALLDPLNLSPEPAYHGRQLPLRPVHDLDAGLSWSASPAGPDASWLTLDYRVTVVSGTFLDAANLHPLPRRDLHAASLWLRPWPRGPHLLVEAQNLLDRRVEELPLTRRGPGDPAHVPAAIADFTGYPLPGRTLFASLLWSTEGAE